MAFTRVSEPRPAPPRPATSQRRTDRRRAVDLRRRHADRGRQPGGRHLYRHRHRHGRVQLTEGQRRNPLLAMPLRAPFIPDGAPPSMALRAPALAARRTLPPQQVVLSNTRSLDFGRFVAGERRHDRRERQPACARVPAASSCSIPRGRPGRLQVGKSSNGGGTKAVSHFPAGQRHHPPQQRRQQHGGQCLRQRPTPSTGGPERRHARCRSARR